MRRYFELVTNFEYYNSTDMKKTISIKRQQQIGDLVLRNNQCSPTPAQIPTKGILVDDAYYLDIDSILKTPISKKEAVFYGKQMKMLLPTKKQMQKLEQNLETINNSLLSIGRGDCMLFGTLRKEFWTRCDKPADITTERRGVLFLVPI